MPDYSKQLAKLRPCLSPQKIRDLILDRTPFCAFCLRPIDLSNATKDHVKPRSRGGTFVVSNILICCESCNLAKGARTPEQWAFDILRSRDFLLESVRHVYTRPSDSSAHCLFCDRPQYLSRYNSECVERVRSLQISYRNLKYKRQGSTDVPHT